MPINFDGFRYFNEGDDPTMPQAAGVPIAKVDYRIPDDPGLHVSDTTSVDPGTSNYRALPEFPGGFQTLVIEALTMDDSAELTNWEIASAWWGGHILAVDLYVSRPDPNSNPPAYIARARMFMQDGWHEDTTPREFFAPPPPPPLEPQD